MDTDAQPSSRGEEQPEPVPTKRRNVPWLRILIVLLLVVVLGGGFVLIQVLRASQSAQTTSFFTTAAQKHGMCVVNGPELNGRPALNAVVATSANDIWAVGSLAGQMQAQLIEHWNGSFWSTMPGPNTGSNNSELNGIAALSATDIWAVGASSIPNEFSAQAIPGNHTLTEHWNGQQWSIAPSPDAAKVEQANSPGGTIVHGFNQLNGIAAISANDIWAVGGADENLGDQSPLNPFPLVEHWDGSRWSIAHLPALPNNATLSAITAVSANDVWAAGQSFEKRTLLPEALFAHWNGQQWSWVQSPDVGGYGNDPVAISASAANDIWAVGSKMSNTSPGPLLEHWDGAQWSQVTVPHLASPAVLMGVTALAANNVWIVGGSPDYGSSGPGPAVIEHWNGKSWNAMPQARAETGHLNNIAGVSGKIWAVGTSLTGLQAVPATLIERSC